MTTTTKPAGALDGQADVAEIRRALDLLAVPGGVVEIRALKIPGRGKPHSAAGYFTDLDKAAEAAAALDGRKAGGVYLVLNEINPALFAQAPIRQRTILNRPPATATFCGGDGCPWTLTPSGPAAFPRRKMSTPRRKTPPARPRGGCLPRAGRRRS